MCGGESSKSNFFLRSQYSAQRHGVLFHYIPMTLSTQAIVYIFLIPTHLIHVALSFRYMLSRHHNYPYKARPIKLTTLFVIGTMLCGNLLSMRRILPDYFNCWSYFIGVISAAMVGLCSDLLRMNFIYYQYVHAERLIALCDLSVIQESGLPKKMIEERRRFSDSNLTKYYLVLLILGELMLLALYLSKPDLVAPGDYEECYVAGWIHPMSIQMVIFGVSTPASIYCEKRLNTVKESCFLQEEYIRTKPIRIAAFIVTILTLSVPALFQFSVRVFWYLDLVLMYMISIFVHIATVDPMQLYKKRIVAPRLSRRAQGATARVIRMEVFLKDADNYLAFQKFLSEEFCAENLLFWRAATDLETLDQEDRAEAITLAQYILDTFVHPDSSFCVNISSGARSEAIAEFEKASDIDDIRYVFDSAKMEILELLAVDPFYRYESQYPTKVKLEIPIL